MNKKYDDLPKGFKTEDPVSNGQALRPDSPVNGTTPTIAPTNQSSDPLNGRNSKQTYPVNSYVYSMDIPTSKKRQKATRKTKIILSSIAAALVLVAVVITVVCLTQSNPPQGEPQTAYKVTFYSQDGKKVLNADDIPYGTSVTDISPAVLVDGRPVISWSDKPNGAEYKGAVTKEMSLYARVLGVYLTYDTSDSNYAPTIIAAEGDKVSLPAPTRENHEFIGWSYNGRLVDDSFVIPDKNVTLVAQWKRTHYRITFDNGYGQQETQIVAVGDSVVSTFSARQGYKFSYWEDLYGKRYPIQFEPTDDAYLTAVWTANSYTVTLNACGGTVWTSFQTVTYDSTFKLPVPSKASESDSYTYKYSKNGAKSNTVSFTKQYAFLGWFTSQSGGTRVTDCWGYGSMWNRTSDLMLYAQWAPLTAKYGKISTVTVNTSKYPLYATIDLASLFGVSISYLRSMGYTKMTFHIFPTLHEVDDGWQEMYFSRANSHADSDIIWKDTAIEHTSGSKDTSTWTHYFTATVDLTSVRDYLYVILDAHGKSSDTWKMTQLDVYFTVS